MPNGAPAEGAPGEPVRGRNIGERKGWRPPDVSDRRDCIRAI
jgi:hypothetical protein